MNDLNKPDSVVNNSKWKKIVASGLLLSYPIIYAVANRLRGSGKVSKIFMYLLMAVVPALIILLKYDWKIALITFGITLGGTWLGFCWGWGKYFPHERDTSKEKEVGLVDWITNKVIGKYTSESTAEFAIKWKTFAMGIRFLFFAPKYIGWAIAFSNYYILLFIPLLFLVGYIYAVCFKYMTKNNKDKHLESSEIVTGIWIGVIDSVILAIV